MKWEELKTSEAVLAAFAEGRQVEYRHRLGGWVEATPKNTSVAGMRIEFADGHQYRALIEEPEEPEKLEELEKDLSESWDKFAKPSKTTPEIPAGYTPWSGGECPEDARGVKTTVYFRNGFYCIEPGDGRKWSWKHEGYGYDIIAYRVESEQAQSDGCGACGDGCNSGPCRLAIAYAIACNRMTAGEAVKLLRKQSEGPGGEDGPWADGWEERSKPVAEPFKDGRDAEGVEGLDLLAVLDAQPFTADNDATRVWQLFRDANAAPRHLAAIAELIARRLRPQVDDAGIERMALQMLFDRFPDRPRDDLRESFKREPTRDHWLRRARAAITAALTEAGHGK